MRKIITSSVLILLFSLFSGSVFAGKIEACENIKHDPAYKGLYGLCNAYWNADENAQDKILAKFEKKAGPGGPGMPGLEATCPCWDADVLAEVTEGKFGAFCIAGGEAGFDEAFYVVNDPYLFAGSDGGLYPEPTCVLQSPSSVVFHDDLSAEEVTVCRAGVQAMYNSYFPDGSPVFPPCF